jgi:hypothetical protein
MARHGTLGGTLILDAEGLVKLADGHQRTMSFALDVRDANGSVITAASTITEVFRGGPRDAKLHRVLGAITVVPIDKQLGMAAGELLGRTGLSGHQHALDALLAVIALGQPRPAVLLTSDPDDLRRLTEEPERPRAERIAVIRV